MSPGKNADPVVPETTTLSVSLSLTLWIILVTVAAVTLSLLYLPIFVGLPIVLMFVLYAWRALRLHAGLTHSTAIVAMRWGVMDISYQLRNGQWLHGQLQNGGLITRWVTVMRIRDAMPSRQIRYIVLTPDRISVQAFRESRRQMLWGRRLQAGQELRES